MHFSQSLLLAIMTASICYTGCDAKLCSVSFCKLNEYCFMKSSPCTNETCPDVASCISKEYVCSTSFPYKDKNQAIMQCSMSSDVCPNGYQCQSGYCCVDVGQPSIDDGLENFGDENGDIPPLSDIFGSLGIDSVQECNPCHTQRCAFATCNYHERVRCVPDNCSCTIAFKDLNGRLVQCEVPHGGEIPGFPGIPQDVNLPVDITSPPVDTEDATEALAHTSMTLEDKSFAKKATEATMPMELLTDSSTKMVSLTLQSLNNGDSKDCTAIYIIGALGLVLLLTAIAYSAYKIYAARRAKQDDDDVEGVKVPLQDMSSHNNNEVKATEKLENGHSAGGDS